MYALGSVNAEQLQGPTANRVVPLAQEHQATQLTICLGQNGVAVSRRALLILVAVNTASRCLICAQQHLKCMGTSLNDCLLGNCLLGKPSL